MMPNISKKVINITLIVLILIICAGFTIIFLLKREIKSITRELNDYNKDISHKKISVCLFDKDIENLAVSINKNIDLNIDAQAKQRGIEDDIKKSIANISHDLRTPLTSVIGYIQMIRKNDLTKDEQDRYLDIALNRSKSLHRLLNDFFELSVIESPEYKLKNELVDISNVLCQVLTSFYEDFTSKGIVPEINMPDKNITAMANEKAIRRVIENLIVNMIKYSDGKANIKLEANGDDVVLCTSNSALNVREEDVNSIFDRFYNGDISRTNSNSTGLGLTIAKSLMEKMGGKIHAELKQGKLYIYCKWKIYRLSK